MTNALSWPTSVKCTSVGASGSGGVRKYNTCNVCVISHILCFVVIHLCLIWAPLSMAKLTGRLFSYKRLTLHSTIDGVDVEAVQCAWLQVSDISICVG